MAALAQLREDQRRERAAAAAGDGDVCRIGALEALHFDFAAVLDEYGQTALIIAASHGQTTVVKKLLRLGGDSTASANVRSIH